MFGKDSSAAKRARVAMQLRDKNGRWIEMGGLVKWFDKVDGKEQSGVVRDILDDGRAVIDRTDRPGGYVARVQGHLLEAINEKASLDTPKAPDKAPVPTKTIKTANQSKVGGFDISVNEGAVSIHKPDGYGSGSTIALSHANMDKLDKALKDGTTGSVDLGGGTTAHIAKGTIGFRSQTINPNDGTPGPFNALVTSRDDFAEIYGASKKPLSDKEVPDYSKMPKAEPKPAGAPYVPKKPVLAPRHTLYDGSSKIEITDSRVKIFTDDGYGTGDSAILSKDNFKKVLDARGSSTKTEINGYSVSFKEDGSVNFFSRDINPNDGSFGASKSVTISAKALEDISKTIDEPLPDATDATTFSWNPLTEKSASELSIGSVLKSRTGTSIKKVSENTWQYVSNGGTLSYNDNSIDSFKLIDSIFFDVELYS